MSYGAESQPRGEVSLTVIRADGTVVPIGVVERTHHRTLLHQAWFHLVTKPRTERRIRAANRAARSTATPD